MARKKQKAKKKKVKGKIGKRKLYPRIRRTPQELVIKVMPISPVPTSTELATPMQDGGKYMIPKTWVSERQVLRLVQQTDPKFIYHRKAKGGGQWAYVTAQYIEKVLNFTFGWNWDFEIVSHGRDGDLVWVQGKLTVKDDKGHTITKSQFGRAEVKYLKDKSHEPKNMLDYGNDLKAAASDALKKCASMLGIASDVYGKTEYRQETGRDVVEISGRPADAVPVDQISQPAPQEAQKQKPGQVVGPDGALTYVCGGCDAPISEQEATYSLRMFKKRLCRECQPGVTSGK